MSRDAFTYDPQDAGQTRDTATCRSVLQQGPTSPDTRGSRNAAHEAAHRGDGTEAREQHSTRHERNDSPRSYYVRDRSYLLRDSEVNSLKEIGKFRVIPVSDLAKFSYSGNRERMEKDVRALARQSLLRDKTLEISQKKTLRVVTLTKAGHRLLKNTNQVPDDQPIYHGLLKPREVKHDADLYRLYQKEAARIERGGGRPVRVLLDYELKRNLNRDLPCSVLKKTTRTAREKSPQSTFSALSTERSPFPICVWSTKTQSSNCAMSTWNWRRATTGREPWR